MKGPLDVHLALLGASVEHEVVHLPRVIVSAGELPEVLGLPSAACGRIRIYHADDVLVATLLPADRSPRPDVIAAATRASIIRLADDDTVNAVTDSVAGLVSPIGLPGDLTLIADAAFAAQDVVYTPTGDGGTALKIRAQDLIVYTGARVLDLAGDPFVGLSDAALAHPGIALR